MGHPMIWVQANSPAANPVIDPKSWSTSSPESTTSSPESTTSSPESTKFSGIDDKFSGIDDKFSGIDTVPV
jgi:hypothetical protein